MLLLEDEGSSAWIENVSRRSKVTRWSPSEGRAHSKALPDYAARPGQDVPRWVSIRGYHILETRFEEPLKYYLIGMGGDIGPTQTLRPTI